MPPSSYGANMMHYNPEAVDVWAMGVMLYLMLTGTYPFEDLNQPGQSRRLFTQHVFALNFKA